MDQASFRKYLCEFIGTFSLVFFAAGAVMIDSLGLGIGVIGSVISSGGIIIIVIFTFGQVSGVHVNRALFIDAA